jgi:cysteinyl-tRNA synthetase
VADLAARREAARKARDFPEADALRAKIRDAGYEVIDVRSGPPRLRKI